MTLLFKGSKGPSIGVEIELQLLNPHSFDLTPESEKIIAICQEKGIERVKSETHQSMVEIDSEISNNVKECRSFLSTRLEQLFEVVESQDLTLGVTATHPFQKWEERLISTSKRYKALHERYQWLFKRMSVYGLHVHIGISSGDRAWAICKALTPYLHHLLALSANSPYWQSIDTGMNSCRINIMDALPFAGAPPQFENWEEFQNYYDLLIRAKVIRSLKDLYWHIRPSPIFGTLEFRCCDAMSTLSETMAVVALIHCLVSWVDEHLGEIGPFHKQQKWLFIENFWTAARYGLDGFIVANLDGDRIKISDTLLDLVHHLMPTAKKLNCQEELSYISEMIKKGNGATRQRRVYQETGSFKQVVQSSIDELKSDLEPTLIKSFS